MKIKTAAYTQSAVNLSTCPKDGLPEFAFIGRSNVGKSSLINFLTGRKGLALTSSKPGKTKSINHFLIDNAWYLVDLPGYGFAQISHSQREKWIKNTEIYLQKRDCLVNVFLLIDASIPPQGKDLEFADWMGEKGVPFSIVFTKSDKAKQLEVNRNMNDFRKKMKERWEELPPMFVTSAEKGLGRDEILGYISQCLDMFAEAKAGGGKG